MIASAPEEMKVHSLKPDSQFSTEGASSIQTAFFSCQRDFVATYFAMKLVKSASGQ
jgi:hypothetical protein